MRLAGILHSVGLRACHLELYETLRFRSWLHHWKLAEENQTPMMSHLGLDASAGHPKLTDASQPDAE